MKVYDITKEIMSTEPYEGDPKPKLEKLKTISTDGYNLSAINMSLHSATHVDAPLHFIKKGMDVTEFDPALFVGPCLVLSTGSQRLDAMFFMRYGHSERMILRGNGELTESGIGYLYNNGTRLIGTDRSSIGSPSDEMSTHLVLLSYKMAILENLDLDDVPDGSYTLYAAPLKIKGAEGAPCRALLIKE